MRASLTGEFEGIPLKLTGGAAKIIERLTSDGDPVKLPAGLTALMLASKKKLAEGALEAGESWLTNLSDDELSELVKLEIDKN